MSQFYYLKQELYYHFRRSTVTLVSVSLVVSMAVTLTAISNASSDALQLSLENVGADIVVQLSGDIPKKLEGLVFPYPTAQLPADAVERISKLTGVIRTTIAVCLWDLSQNKFQSLLGVDSKGTSGIPGFNSQLISGKPLDTEVLPVEALVDGDFASKNKMKAGDQIELQGQSYRISGTVDTPKSGNIMRADIYLPLAEAQLLTSNAPWIVDLYPFTQTDVNLLFLEFDQRHLVSVTSTVEKIVG
jgi:lipoprotein-releasing system permease protein